MTRAVFAGKVELFFSIWYDSPATLPQIWETIKKQDLLIPSQPQTSVCVLTPTFSTAWQMDHGNPWNPWSQVVESLIPNCSQSSHNLSQALWSVVCLHNHLENYIYNHPKAQMLPELRTVKKPDEPLPIQKTRNALAAHAAPHTELKRSSSPLKRAFRLERKSASGKVVFVVVFA